MIFDGDIKFANRATPNIYSGHQEIDDLAYLTPPDPNYQMLAAIGDFFDNLSGSGRMPNTWLAHNGETRAEL